VLRQTGSRIRLSDRVPHDVLGVVVHHYPPFDDQPGAGGKANIARTMFETDRLPPSWRDRLLVRDEVWVPSRHNRAIFVAAGLDPSRVKTVPPPLPRVPHRRGRRSHNGPITFLSVFYFIERKGWRDLLVAWARAFDWRDDVQLLIKTRSTTRMAAEIEATVADDLWRAASGKRLAPVVVDAVTRPTSATVALYAQADAFVLPSRGEAWGLPYTEALMGGLPAIASRCTGMLDFVLPEFAWLIDGELVRTPEDLDTQRDFAHHDADLFRGHRWFQCDIDLLVAALREVARDIDGAAERAAPAREWLLNRFGDSMIGRLVTDRLSEYEQ
jgi:glycosyltransferase involved in cell wall biosynthesis